MRANKHQARYSHHLGIATLEFVMAMPVLLLLMVALTWLGYSVIGQTEVIIEARNKAWQKRFTNASDKPLVFPTAKGLYSREKDYVTEMASKQVKVSPVFDGLPGPSSTHTILAGSWDYSAMPLTDPPNKKLILTAVASGTLGKVQIGLGDFENFLGKMGDIADTAKDNAIAEGDGMTGPNASKEEGAKSATEEKQEQERKEKWELAEKLNGQISQTSTEINDLRQELAQRMLKQETDEEKKRLNQQEIDRLSREIDILKAKRERLESELNDVMKDLEALG